MALNLGLVRTRYNVFNLCKQHLEIKVRQPAREFKSSLKIKWVRPEKVPCIRPEMSGDLSPLGTLDMTQFPSTYKASGELSSANEIVQRIHTLEFSHRQQLKEEFLIEYTNRVKAHQLDDDSPEVRIAKMTVIIRNLQIHVEKFPSDTANKVKLKSTIDRRKAYLSHLRSADYKKYEWILEKLDIQHKIFGVSGRSERVERKKSLRRLTALFIEKLKTERLVRYKSYLESQKESFMKEKLEKLIWMKKTEEEYGVTPSVTEADIDSVRKQLQALNSVSIKTIAN